MIVEARMSNQFLWGTKKANVLKDMLAMQAQEFPYAKWSLAQRTPGLTEAMVDKAFAEGAILRTHLMRPTWHFVSREDIAWLVELTAPRVKAVNAPYHRANEVTGEMCTRASALFEKALGDGEHLERKQMRAVLEAAGLELTNLQLGFLLSNAELDRVICSGAPRGKQQTYALLDLRAPGAKRLERDEAIAELAKRYFTTRGPATLKDFAWWSGLTMADGKRGAADAGISSEVIDGRTYYHAGMPKAKEKSPRIDLVQIYDEIGMAYTESRHHLSIPDLPRPDPAPYYHSILLDGRLIGHWRRNVKGKAISFDTHLFRRLDGAENEALEAAMRRFRGYSSVAQS
ncbi:MAG TPA: winged helix DNA-binding domain-containing protein [Candidatus Limnocylindrales bacterium]|nr:winged helix DNA-binding domain-containing protein [Candidatus Limnocylindrales bacterium]